MMNSDLRQLLQKMYKEGQQNDARETGRSKKMLNLEQDTAHFLSILVRSSRRRRLLEIGTSNGYSTIWLAWATQAIEGHVISIDRDPAKQALANENLQRAGLREVVDLVCGDATEIVKECAGPFDFVFFDADRLSAPAQLQLLVPKLTSDAVVLADNVHSHPDEIASYLAALESLNQFDHMILSLGKGLSLAYKS